MTVTGTVLTLIGALGFGYYLLWANGIQPRWRFSLRTLFVVIALVAFATTACMEFERACPRAARALWVGFSWQDIAEFDRVHAYTNSPPYRSSTDLTLLAFAAGMLRVVLVAHGVWILVWLLLHWLRTRTLP